MRDVSSHVVMNASQALTVLLEDGERLHIDDRTPYGTYVQGPERSIEVTSPLGYPRSFTERGPFWRQFSFRIERVMTGRWIGALTSPPDVSASAEDYLREIPREGWTLPLRDEDRFVAFEYPRDWWPNAAYKLDSRRTSPFKLTWFVYGDPLPRPEPRNGLVRTEHGVRFDPMLADFAFGGPRWPEAAYWTAPGDAAKLHVVG